MAHMGSRQSMSNKILGHNMRLAVLYIPALYDVRKGHQSESQDNEDDNNRIGETENTARLKIYRQ